MSRGDCAICRAEAVEVSSFNTFDMCAACRAEVLRAIDASPAFAAIVETAGRLGLPEAYPRDLYLHDRAFLLTYAPRTFVWCVGASGTSIATWAGKGPTRDADGYARSLREQRPHAYEWDGRTLKRIDYNRVRGALRAA